MSRLPFVLVDVFAERAYAGNPLAVVADAEALPTAALAALARELQQAETTFVLPPTRSGADRRLRSFTAAGVEVFGAGHNSLGAWWWLAEAQLALSSDRVELAQELGDRVLPVTVVARGGRPIAIELEQAPPRFGAIVEERDALARALGLERDDLAAALPAQAVSTGASHLLVPIADRRRLTAAAPDTRALAAVLSRAGAQGCYAFALDRVEPTSAAHARFFNPTVGLYEDIATGSAAGPLACYLVARGVVRDGSDVTIEQGDVLGRPSRLRVRAAGDRVHLVGRGVTVAEGTLRAPELP